MSRHGPSAEIRDGAPAVSFRILGALEVHGPRGLVPISPGRQEVVLAALLLELNRVVTIDHLVHLIWGERPAATARTQVQICVSRIRGTLAEAGCPTLILTRPRGYMIRADGDLTDIAMFTSRVARSHVLVQEGRRADAVDMLRSAVALWRGPCLNGIPSDALASRGHKLDESRLAALETCLELQLDLGRHHLLISELSQLVDEHPLRERLRGYLMLALYRSGRQAEALAVYRVGRELLDRELGLDPGKSLRLLETAILTDDPGLHIEPDDDQAPVRPASPVPVTSPPHHPAGPRQLPADIADFVGGVELTSRVGEVLLGDDPRRALCVAVLSGKPGVGKSAAAIHIAHRLRDEHFPDGQLYCDLRGASSPLKAEEALGRFLRALGIPGPALPDPLDERAEMYRALLANRRMLVVLDDAVSEAQIAPLLPGSGGCAVIVTSRPRLTALPGAHLVEMEAFGTEHAIDLLGRVIGRERVAAEPEAAERLVRTVGGLPLALRIIAARLAARPHWTLASMVHRLGNERRNLDELTHGDMTVRASLHLTYGGLTPVDRRLLRLLSLSEAPTLPGWLAGALLDDDRAYPSDLLEPLVDMHMLDVVGIESTGEFRYRLHEIVRMFARGQREAESAAEEQAAATQRMVGGWLALAEQAHRKVYGGDYLVLHGDATRWHPAPEHARALVAEPLKWLDGELGGLCAAVDTAARAGLDELCWDLATTLVTLFEARGHYRDWESTHRLALAATRQADNRRGTAAVLASLGTLYLSRRQLDDAETSVTLALATFDDLGDDLGRALCLRDLALKQRLQGRDEQALALYERATSGFDRGGDIVGRASTLTQTAHIWMRRGEFTEAQVRLEEALEVYRSVGYARGQSIVLRRMGQLLMHRDRLDEAERVLCDVLAVVTANGDATGAGHVLRDLGEVSIRQGRYEQAEQYFERALAAWEQIMDQGNSAQVRLDIARLAEKLDR